MNKNETLSWKKHAWRMLGLLLIVSIMPMVISCSNKQEKKQSAQAEQSVVKEKVQSSAVETNFSVYKDDIYEDEEPCGGDEPDLDEYADVFPEFPGGMGAFMSYLKDNIKYPESARKEHIQGRVIVQFLVTKSGEIADPVVVRSVEEALDTEALRVIKSMPKWTPGLKDGKKIDLKYTVPVTFRLDE